MSGSSSELARASESGVERLALSFSSNIDGLLADIEAYAGCAVLPLGVAFILLHKAPQNTQLVFGMFGQDDADSTKHQARIEAMR